MPEELLAIIAKLKERQLAAETAELNLATAYEAGVRVTAE